MDNFRRNSSQNLIFSPNCCDHKKACSGAPFEFRRYPFRSKALGLSQTHKRMHTQSYVKVVVKATFHYSSQLFSTRFAARFSTSSCGFATCFRHAFDLLATCFRHAHASRKPGLQLGRIMECGLYGHIKTAEQRTITAIQ